MAFTNQSGVKIYYEMVGDPTKPVLLMNPGLGNIVANWYSLGYVKALSPHFCLLMYDVRGFGESEKCYNVEDYAPEKLMADITAVLDAANVKQSHFFGNSRGGILGLMASKFIPERFESFIVAGTNPFGSLDIISVFAELIEENLSKGGMALVESIEALLGDRFPSKAREEYAQNDLKSMLAATQAMLPQYDCSAAFAKLSQPHLFYVGEMDEYCQAMVDFAKQHQFECIVLKGLDHAQAWWQGVLASKVIINFINVNKQSK